MNEEQLERGIECRTDELDRALMRGTLTQAAYDDAIRELGRWAESYRSTVVYVLDEAARRRRGESDVR